jgi:hypothetical protein
MITWLWWELQRAYFIHLMTILSLIFILFTTLSWLSDFSDWSGSDLNRSTKLLRERVSCSSPISPCTHSICFKIPIFFQYNIDNNLLWWSLILFFISISLSALKSWAGLKKGYLRWSCIPFENFITGKLRKCANIVCESRWFPCPVLILVQVRIYTTVLSCSTCRITNFRH